MIRCRAARLTRRIARRMMPLLLAPAASACTDQRRELPAVDATPATSATVDSTAASSVGCPETGAWRECSVQRRLERAGLVPVRQEIPSAASFLVAPGVVFALGPDTLHVHLYESAAELRRDLARIDSARAAPRDSQVTWTAAPTLIVSNNLAAVLVGGSPRKVERVSNALTAGMPQP